MKNQVKVYLLIVAAVCLLGIVGRIGADSTQTDLNIYCDNVKENIWPDYKKIYKTSCIE